VPTVDLTPPYSEHLFRDFGGATLGIAVVIWLERRGPDQHVGLVGAPAAGADRRRAVGITCGGPMEPLIGSGSRLGL
jgi:hypothetical protein